MKTYLLIVSVDHISASISKYSSEVTARSVKQTYCVRAPAVVCELDQSFISWNSRWAAGLHLSLGARFRSGHWNPALITSVYSQSVIMSQTAAWLWAWADVFTCWQNELVGKLCLITGLSPCLWVSQLFVLPDTVFAFYALEEMFSTMVLFKKYFNLP